MKLPKYFAITDRKQFRYDFEKQIRIMLDKGIKLFQLREKDLNSEELFKLAKIMENLLRNYDAKFVVNDRLDIALLTEAIGVHLPEKSIPIGEIKKKYPDLIVGKSCHSLEQCIEAEKEGADYIYFSPIFNVPNKGKAVGIEKLKEVCQAVSIPVYALGGINEKNIDQVFNAGAYGIASIRFFIS